MSFIGIDIRGEKALAKNFSLFESEFKGYGTEAANEYIINSLQSGQPPYRHVSRKQAYPGAPAGPGWFSDRQRRYVMASIRSGAIKIPYQRTQALRKAWKAVGVGENQIIVNENKAAPYAYDDQRQANQMALVGWDTLGWFIRERMAKIVAAYEAGVEKAAKKFGFMP